MSMDSSISTSDAAGIRSLLHKYACLLSSIANLDYMAVQRQCETSGHELALVTEARVKIEALRTDLGLPLNLPFPADSSVSQVYPDTNRHKKPESFSSTDSKSSEAKTTDTINILRALDHSLLPEAGRLKLLVELLEPVTGLDVMLRRLGDDKSPEKLRRDANNSVFFTMSEIEMRAAYLPVPELPLQVTLWPRLADGRTGLPVVLLWEGIIVEYDWQEEDSRSALVVFNSTSPVTLPQMVFDWKLKEGSVRSVRPEIGRIDGRTQIKVPMRKGAIALNIRPDNPDDESWRTILLRETNSI